VQILSIRSRLTTPFAVGKTLAYTSVKFMNKDNDIVVARGSHTKYVSFAWKDEKNITDQLKPE
jgi:hypothetical protein